MSPTERIKRIRERTTQRIQKLREALQAAVRDEKTNRDRRIKKVKERVAEGATKLSKAGVELIAEFEGFVSTPYNDAAGHATIGYGHLLHLGNVTQADISRWGSISRVKGLDLLRSDARDAQDAVDSLVKVSLNQNQFDALVSFTFNVGEGALSSSTLLKVLNAGDYKAVPAELKKWVHAGGTVVPGLVNRRNAEAALWNE